jgi:hypothetical protein
VDSKSVPFDRQGCLSYLVQFRTIGVISGISVYNIFSVAFFLLIAHSS